MTETLTTEQVEEIRDNTLWSVNIQGPDDVFATRSLAEAIELATKFNEWWVLNFAAKGLHPYDPTLWAVPTPWRYDEASHARSLADTEGEYAWLRDPSVTSLATELLALRKRVGELEGALEDAARMAERGILSADGGQAASEIRSLTPQRLRQTTNLETTASIGGLNDLTSIIAHGIADAQGDAYAEYASEFDGYAKAAVDALKKNLAGFSTNGINVWGSPDDIKAVVNWQHSHVTIVHLRRDLGHWREECGKVNAHRREMLDVLKRAIAVWDADDFDELAANAVLKDAIEIVARLEKRA